MSIFKAASPVVLLITLFCFSSCSKSNEEKLVGKWEWDDGSISEYFDNGTVTIAGTAYGLKVQAGGTWQVEGDRLTINANQRIIVYEIRQLTNESITVALSPSGKISVGSKIK